MICIAHMNKRTTGIIISSLAAVSVISIFSIGFAKWALVETDQANLDGVIYVENVDASSVNKFENTPVVDHAICFGRPTDSQISSWGITNPWLDVNGTKYEVLSTYIDVKVSGLTQDNYLDILEVGNLVESSGKYATAVSEGLVGALPTGELSYLTGNSARITFTFSWGNSFNNENPYKYYNLQTQTSTLEADASAKLTRLKALLDGVNYSLTLATKNV